MLRMPTGMAGSFTIATIAGTKVRVHPTFFVLLAWIAAVSGLTGGLAAVATGLAFVILLFACVVAHEFGHIFAASRYGIQTPEIILLPIGGMSLMERLPERPAHELTVALAGPAVSVTLGLVLSLVWGGPSGSDLAHLAPAQLLPNLAATNLFLALFNMLPAFPMDGGRVVRALLALRLGRLRATHVAAALGHGFAIVFCLVALMAGNFVLALLGLFIYFGASAEAADAELLEIAQSLPVSQVMQVEPHSLPDDATLDDAFGLIMRTGQDAILTFSRDGRFAGPITIQTVLEAMHRQGGSAPISGAAITNVATIGQGQSLRDAIDLMRMRRAPAVIVLDAAGTPVGIVTAKGLANLRSHLRATHRMMGRKAGTAFFPH
jgi:stage IV sporulation protein FB